MTEEQTAALKAILATLKEIRQMADDAIAENQVSAKTIDADAHNKLMDEIGAPDDWKASDGTEILSINNGETP